MTPNTIQATVPPVIAQLSPFSAAFSFRGANQLRRHDVERFGRPRPCCLYNCYSCAPESVPLPSVETFTERAHLTAVKDSYG